METVETDHALYGLNTGNGQGPRIEPHLGLAVWRRHISAGLITHTQASRIWRQASQVGQIPLMRHITERQGTGHASVSRTWDSLPFVMVRRLPMVKARTIPAFRSMKDGNNQPPLSTWETTTGEADHRTSPGRHEVLVTERTSQSPSSPTDQSLTLLRHPILTETGAISSLVLQAPIIRRILGKEGFSVSNRSGTDARPDGRIGDQVSEHGDSKSDLAFVQPLPLVQRHPVMARANGDPGVARGLYQTSRMGVGRARNGAELHNDAHVFAKRVISSSAPLLPVVQATERPLPSSDLLPLIWRSPIPEAPIATTLSNGFTNYQTASRSVSPNLSSSLARHVSNPAASYISSSSTPSIQELAASGVSREASNSVNPAEVVLQVSRLLTRQLEVERERRGVNS